MHFADPNTAVSEVVPPDHGSRFFMFRCWVERKLGLPDATPVCLLPQKQGRASGRREVIRPAMQAQTIWAVHNSIVDLLRCIYINPVSELTRTG